MQKMTYIIELVIDNFNNLPIQSEEIAVSDRNVAMTVAKELKKSGDFTSIFVSHLPYKTGEEYEDDPDYTPIDSGTEKIYVNSDELFSGSGHIYTLDEFDQYEFDQ